MSITRSICLTMAILFSGPAIATNVVMQTPFGEVEIELFDEDTPATVANFLNYVNDGDYANSFIHRSVPGFVEQGGGFSFIDGEVVAIPSDSPVINEPGISNLRGTIAMAKRGGDPNSATSQWFINLADNSANLDNSNGGFTVFGQVTGNGMEVIDQIAALERWNAGGALGQLPLIDYSGSGAVTEDHLVMTELAKHHEHRSGDMEQALSFALKAHQLLRQSDYGSAARARLINEAAHRLKRLQARRDRGQI